MVYVKVECHPLFCLLCSLIFNANKTQLAHFSHSIFLSIDSINATTFCFGGQKLQLSQSAKHLGHILCCNLSDNEDISSIKKDLTRKANCMLHTFSCCDPLTKTMLFRSFCLSLYGSALWMSSSSELRSLEITFNNVLRKIWSLPRAYHTGILHQVAGLHSIFNVVVSRSSRLLLSALKSKSPVLIDIFTQSSSLACTSLGFNKLFSDRYIKSYSDQDCLSAGFIRDVKIDPSLNGRLMDEVSVMCTC